MSEENLSDLLERAADRYEISSPPLDQMLSRSRRTRKRRAGFKALAASVVIGSVIAGTTLLFNPDNDLNPNPLDLAGQWKTIEYEGVQVDVPSDWVRSDPTGCGIRVEGWSDPSTNACKFLEGIAFFGTATFDPKGQPKDIRTKSDGSGYGGYVYVGSLAVAADSTDRELVQRVLDSAREVGASPINLEGEWVLAALTDVDGDELIENDPDLADRRMRITLTDGRFKASANCFEVTSSYEQPNDRDLVFKDAKDRLINGADCVSALPLASRLADVRHFSEANGDLQLHAENWMIIAVLERVSVEPAIGLHDPEFATYKSTGASDQALGSGTLTVSNGCLVLSNGGHNRLIVFNDRTAWDGGTLHVVDAFGRTADVKLGDRVSFGGGYGSALGGNGVTVPEACSEAAKHDAFFAGTVD